MDEDVIQVKTCFIITPIGNDNSEIRRKADGVIEAVIIPILKELGFTDIKAAHHINLSGSINNQIVTRIVNDDLVIANLTSLNPNVMYELAIRHATKKPIVHICEKSTSLPFDIKDQRTIYYTDDILGANELKSRLEATIIEVMKFEKSDDNPIYNAIQHKIIEDSISNIPEKEIVKYLFERMDKFEEKLDNMLGGKQTNEVSGTIKVNQLYSKPVWDIKVKIPDNYSAQDVEADLARMSIIRGVNKFREYTDEAGTKYADISIFVYEKQGDIVWNDLKQFIDLNKNLPYTFERYHNTHITWYRKDYIDSECESKKWPSRPNK